MIPLPQDGLDLLFNNAHTKVAWQDKPVAKELLVKLYDLVKMAPTSANCQPLRVTFVESDAAKQRLKPHLAEGNVDKTMAAPVVALLANDTEFYEQLPKLYPHTDAKSWFVGNQQMIDETAFRNGSMQGGYFILAARALGLDCGPMSGFDANGLNKEFFADTTFKVNFICSLGYGTPDGHHPRSPRFSFDEACKVL